jgi:NAD(P)-dependent dehydrogenase (short-subunit alcohol dehydrogenase family)
MNPTIFCLDGRIVVISGGLGQLGRRFSRAVLAAGGRVAILDLTADQHSQQRHFPDLPADAELMCLPCDITQSAQIDAALEQITTRWGTPQGLINNAALDAPPDAGVEQNGPFESFPEAIWDQVMAVNTKGVFLLCQKIGGAMAQGGGGAIVNVSSIYGLVSPDQSLYAYRRQQGEEFFKPAAYSASKSALLNLSRYLATYWGHSGVRVNTLVLGGVFNQQDDRFLANYCARVPMGRMANEDEYSASAVYLLSDASSYMTGAQLVLDGGWTAW